MEQTQRKLTTTKGLLILVVGLILTVGVQAWFLARIYGRVSKAEDLSDNGLPAPTFPGTPSPDGQSPGRLPLWQDDVFGKDWFGLHDPIGPDAWDPSGQMKGMLDRMNRLFDDAFRPFSESPHARTSKDASKLTPHIDLREDDDCFTVEVDLPGADSTKVDVSCKDRQLTISGTVDQVSVDDHLGSTLRQKHRSSRFTQSITLPAPVDPNKMDTRFDDGRMTLKIPKVAP